MKDGWMRVTIEGHQGVGKSILLEVLREAGWGVTDVRAVGCSNEKIEAEVRMPRRSVVVRRKVMWATT